MSEHFIERCTCGIVTSQCRCTVGFGEPKQIRIVPCTHPDPSESLEQPSPLKNVPNCTVGEAGPSTTTPPTPSALTRDQVERIIALLDTLVESDGVLVGDLLKHDDVQRLTIERLERELAAIRDTVGDTEFSLRQQLAARTVELAHEVAQNNIAGQQLVAMADNFERAKTLTWNEHVQFLYESKEGLLQCFCNLQLTYGEQKHEIRSLQHEREGLIAELEEYRSIAERIGARNAVSQLAAMTRERDALQARVTELESPCAH